MAVEKPNMRLTDIGVIPRDWIVCSLEKLAKIERGKFTARPRNDPKLYGGKYPFIQTGDVTRASGIIRNYSQTLNDHGLSVSKLFPEGTLFFTIAANIGDVGITTFATAAPDSLVAFQVNSEVSQDWLAHLLRIKKPLFENIASHNAQKNLNLEKIRPFLIAAPPTKGEQQAVANALSDADALIESW